METTTQPEILTPTREIVEGNLAKMLSGGDGNMQDVIMGESMGGNAGSYKGRPCVAANFHFDKETGEIKYFGNIQDVPEEIKRAYNEGTFKIAFNLPIDGRTKIVQKEYHMPLQEMSPQTRLNLRASAEEYNRQRGF